MIPGTVAHACALILLLVLHRVQLALAIWAVLFLLDVLRLRAPEPYWVVSTGRLQRETRPLSDVVLHVLIFEWVGRLLGTENAIFARLLAAINAPFLSWDDTFASRGEDAEHAVYSYCDKWGIPRRPWRWSKPATEYTTMNEWFSRAFAPEHAPEANLGGAEIVSPATAAITWFESADQLPDHQPDDQPNSKGQYSAFSCASRRRGARFCRRVIRLCRTVRLSPSYRSRP